jgi:hypothetical protein
MKFAYIVTVDTDTVQHADQVMRERLGPDERYTDEAAVQFDYTIDWPAVPAPLDLNVPYVRRFGQ